MLDNLMVWSGMCRPAMLTDRDMGSQGGRIFRVVSICAASAHTTRATYKSQFSRSAAITATAAATRSASRLAASRRTTSRVRKSCSLLWSWWRNVFPCFIFCDFAKMLLGMRANLQDGFRGDVALNLFPVAIVELECMQEASVLLRSPNLAGLGDGIRLSWFSAGVTRRTVLAPIPLRGFLWFLRCDMRHAT